MKDTEIRDHWRQWAQTYGQQLRATTKSSTAKFLEIDALYRRLSGVVEGRPAQVLEVGCGNGANCIGLAQRLASARFHGVDYVDEMVEYARANAREAGVEDRTAFWTGDALDLGAVKGLVAGYDVVFTTRCLINLNTTELQCRAIRELAGRVKPGGTLVMIENSERSYGNQNLCRELIGLEPRTPATFNKFFEEDRILACVGDAGLTLVEIEDFSSLHDLVLYVLLPATNGGKIDYDHPLVEQAARLSAAYSQRSPGAFGAFGQNRMYICRREPSRASQ